MKSFTKMKVAPKTCRPPRGGRGLKFDKDYNAYDTLGRPPRGGRGLKSCIHQELEQVFCVVLLAEDVD